MRTDPNFSTFQGVRSDAAQAATTLLGLLVARLREPTLPTLRLFSGARILRDYGGGQREPATTKLLIARGRANAMIAFEEERQAYRRDVARHAARRAAPLFMGKNRTAAEDKRDLVLDFDRG